MSKIEVNTIEPQSGTTVTVGASGDTITIPSGATLDASNATTTLPANVVTTDGTQTLTNKTINASQLTGTITPSDGTVTTAKIGANEVTGAKLNNDVISAQTELASEPADTDEFLVSDAGTIKRIDYSLIKGGGLTMADQWRITADFSSQSGVITSNFEQIDGTGQGTLGSAMTQSSGIFTFPSTGIYLVKFNHNYYYNGFNQYNQARIDVTTNNSSFSTVAEGNQATANESSNFYVSTMVETLVDVTDTANVKVRFQLSSQNTITTRGRSSDNLTNFTFIRLGDT